MTWRGRFCAATGSLNVLDGIPADSFWKTPLENTRNPSENPSLVVIICGGKIKRSGDQVKVYYIKKTPKNHQTITDALQTGGLSKVAAIITAFVRDEQLSGDKGRWRIILFSDPKSLWQGLRPSGTRLLAPILVVSEKKKITSSLCKSLNICDLFLHNNICQGSLWTNLCQLKTPVGGKTSGNMTSWAAACSAALLLFPLHHFLK